MPETDRTISENSKENLDRKLDHAIKETFPTSDPVSVTITKGGAIDYDEHGNVISGAGGISPESSPSTAKNILDQAKETLSTVAESASDTAREAYDQGLRYVREAADQYPEAERYYPEGTQAIRKQASENPLLTMLFGVAIGYGLAWMIHHKSWRNENGGVPEYGRRQRFRRYGR